MYGGFVMGHEAVDRNRETCHLRLYQDYFSDNPTYGPVLFRRRFVLSLFYLIDYYMNSQLFMSAQE